MPAVTDLKSNPSPQKETRQLISMYGGQAIFGGGGSMLFACFPNIDKSTFLPEPVDLYIMLSENNIVNVVFTESCESDRLCSMIMNYINIVCFTKLRNYINPVVLVRL